MSLRLVSHALCPYVQRAVIALVEKGVAFERTDVDLAQKPDWFLAVSPLGKTPVLIAAGAPIFESAAILEYLEDTERHPLHPEDPLERARHRGWIAFGSAVLDDIAGLYGAPDADAFAARTAALRAKFETLERALDTGPWFAGARFSLVDAVFGPVFRYFDTFDRIADFGILTGLPRLAQWRAALSRRPSVAGAASGAYPDLLEAFILRKDAHLARLLRQVRDATDRAAAGGTHPQS